MPPAERVVNRPGENSVGENVCQKFHKALTRGPSWAPANCGFPFPGRFHQIGPKDPRNLGSQQHPIDPIAVNSTKDATLILLEAFRGQMFDAQAV